MLDIRMYPFEAFCRNAPSLCCAQGLCSDDWGFLAEGADAATGYAYVIFITMNVD